MSLMLKKGIRGGISYSIDRCEKADTKYMTDYDENKESSYNQYQDVINMFGWAISQKLSVNNFQRVKDTSQFHEHFMKKL